MVTTGFKFESLALAKFAVDHYHYRHHCYYYYYYYYLLLSLLFIIVIIIIIIVVVVVVIIIFKKSGCRSCTPFGEELNHCVVLSLFLVV